MIEPKGVWRTIRGRRIFIENGVDLETAMKRSGKFESKKDNSDDEKYKYKDSYESYIEKMNKLGDKVWTGREYTNDEFMEHLTDSNWHTERRMLEEANLTNKELSYIKDRTKLSQYSVDLDENKTEQLIKEAKAQSAKNNENNEKNLSRTERNKGSYKKLKEEDDADFGNSFIKAHYSTDIADFNKYREAIEKYKEKYGKEEFDKILSKSLNLYSMSVSQLRVVAQEYGVESDGLSKKQLMAKLINIFNKK